MVLSNKKLKQKLRSLLVESLAASESNESHKVAAAGDVNQQLQSLREFLVSKSRKPRSSKRAERRKKPPFSDDSKPAERSQDTQKEKGENIDSVGLNGEKGDDIDSVGLNGKQKSRKRKREVDGDRDQESTEKKQKKKQKKKKDKKKEKKKKKKPKDETEEKKDEKGDGSTNEESNGKGVAEPIKIDESEQKAKKVYVGGIPYYSTEDDIRSFFEGCGTVTEVDCMRFPESGKFRGIAVLTFKTEAAANRALALDGADMGGFYLKIQPYKANRTQKSDFAPEIVDGYNRIYVGNLSWDITEDDLRKLFSECKVSSIRFGRDKETDEFKGYAHVDFSDTVSLASALTLDQKAVCGRPVRIRCAVPKKAGETNSGSKPAIEKAEDGTCAGNPKKKKQQKQACYECGVLGHLASACPRKRVVEVEGTVAVEPNSSSKAAVMKAEVGAGVGNSKKNKRRTCYECGVSGHISSACPRKRAVEVDGTGGNS